MLSSSFISVQSNVIINPDQNTPNQEHLAHHWVTSIESELQKKQHTQWSRYQQMPFHQKCAALQTWHRQNFIPHRAFGKGDLFSEMTLIRTQKVC